MGTLSRRQFGFLVTAAAGTASLAACTSPPSPQPTGNRKRLLSSPERS